MRIYILVEGKCSEYIVYPEWISILKRGSLIQVKSITNLLNQDNSFYIISAEGYPNVLDTMLPNSLDEICSTDLINHFIVSFDIDEESLEHRVNKAFNIMRDYFTVNYNSKLKCCVHIIVQNVCFETWFLGNNTFCNFNSTDKMYLDFVRHYDINDLDPEELPNYGSTKTTPRFHSSYFKRVCRAKRLSYIKSDPSIVCTPEFLQGIVNRINQTDHLNSFRYFHQVISNL